MCEGWADIRVGGSSKPACGGIGCLKQQSRRRRQRPHPSWPSLTHLNGTVLRAIHTRLHATARPEEKEPEQDDCRQDGVVQQPGAVGWLPPHQQNEGLRCAALFGHTQRFFLGASARQPPARIFEKYCKFRRQRRAPLLCVCSRHGGGSTAVYGHWCCEPSRAAARGCPTRCVAASPPPPCFSVFFFLCIFGHTSSASGPPHSRPSAPLSNGSGGVGPNPCAVSHSPVGSCGALLRGAGFQPLSVVPALIYSAPLPPTLFGHTMALEGAASPSLVYLLSTHPPDIILTVLLRGPWGRGVCVCVSRVQPCLQLPRRLSDPLCGLGWLC